MKEAKVQEKLVEIRKTETHEYSLTRLSNADLRELEERGIGELRDESFVLKPIELIYLSIAGYRVLINGKEIGVGDLIKEINNPHALTVYLDMRKRGYFIKPVVNGPVDFLVWEKGEKPSNLEPKVHD
ncbi:hypothetical protein [Vulcanisaeta souniana]|uniref:hypothetical protein n=1 Tax=Vulcanisaeta souniana TaxID=164452 RepID=UPI000B2A5604|nr:hypothetical protein [Vulcanisaeta souniana]